MQMKNFEHFTRPMPAIAEFVRRRSGGEPKGQQADDEAGEVHQQVSSIGHHCKASCKIAPWEEKGRQKKNTFSEKLVMNKEIAFKKTFN